MKILFVDSLKRILLKSRRSTNQSIRDPELLFSEGKVFEATEQELTNILKKLTTEAVSNPLVRHREIARAITVNAVIFKKHIDKIDSRNTWLTGLVVVLTIINLFLTFRAYTVQVPLA